MATGETALYGNVRAECGVWGAEAHFLVSLPPLCTNTHSRLLLHVYAPQLILKKGVIGDTKPSS